MSKVTSSADPAAEAPATPERRRRASGRAKSRPPTKAGGPVRSRVPGTSKRPSPYSDLGRDAPSSAQRRAAAILEVLAGEQTAAEAARAAGHLVDALLPAGAAARCRDWWRPARRVPRGLRVRGRSRSWFGCGANWSVASASASGKRPWCEPRSGRWGSRPAAASKPKVQGKAGGGQREASAPSAGHGPRPAGGAEPASKLVWADRRQTW